MARGGATGFALKRIGVPVCPLDGSRHGVHGWRTRRARLPPGLRGGEGAAGSVAATAGRDEPKRGRSRTRPGTRSSRKAAEGGRSASGRRMMRRRRRSSRSRTGPGRRPARSRPDCATWSLDGEERRLSESDRCPEPEADAEVSPVQRAIPAAPRDNGRSLSPLPACGMSRRRPGSRFHANLNVRQWARARSLCLHRAGWRCARCGGAGALECHHRVELRHGGAPYDQGNLECLCRDCHIREHARPVSPEVKAWQTLVEELM